MGFEDSVRLTRTVALKQARLESKQAPNPPISPRMRGDVGGPVYRTPQKGDNLCTVQVGVTPPAAMSTRKFLTFPTRLAWLWVDVQTPTCRRYLLPMSPLRSQKGFHLLS